MHVCYTRMHYYYSGTLKDSFASSQRYIFIFKWWVYDSVVNGSDCQTRVVFCMTAFNWGKELTCTVQKNSAFHPPGLMNWVCATSATDDNLIMLIYVLWSRVKTSCVRGIARLSAINFLLNFQGLYSSCAPYHSYEVWIQQNFHKTSTIWSLPSIHKIGLL
jgi:hypothetical protein